MLGDLLNISCIAKAIQIGFHAQEVKVLGLLKGESLGIKGKKMEQLKSGLINILCQKLWLKIAVIHADVLRLDLLGERFWNINVRYADVHHFGWISR